MTTQSITGVHPVAQLFPLLAADEFAEFLESVKRDGLLTPVTIDPKGVLLDGRDRLKACGLAESNHGTSSTKAIRLHSSWRPISTVVISMAVRSH